MATTMDRVQTAPSVQVRSSNASDTTTATLPYPRLESSLWVSPVDYYLNKLEIHRIRQSVFVYEQRVPLSFETDEMDPLSCHVLAHWQGWAVGTGRLAPDGRIGRVAVSRPLRRRGVGRKMMETLLKVAVQEGHDRVFLSAQCHAVRFYERLGFQTEGGVYRHVGIDHITMTKQLRP